ncbi:MAG: cytochrome c [Verrucomicrobiota bacterium]|nr:cytochrome c [Verrucomicrobiota bacterium]
MSEENKQIDSLQPSWAAHELFALALTLVLAVWIVSKYGKEARPQSLTTDRDEARAAKRAELKKADEEALGSHGVVDESRKVYRLPVADAMRAVVSRMNESPGSLHKELVSRSMAAAGLAVAVPTEELKDPALIAQGKTLFQTKICFTCHQVDPAVPAPAGLALKAPSFMDEFWGEEREVHKGLGGPIEKVKFDAAYFVESIRKPMDKVVKGALAPMPPPPPITDDELKALMAYVKSLSKK